MSHSFLKDCADHLRAKGKLNASHAHELIAAYFGYKSHAALLLEQDFPLQSLDEVEVLIPDISLLSKRLNCLIGNQDEAKHIIENITSFLQSEKHLTGEIWLTENLEEYIEEKFIPDNQSEIDNDLSGVMAETNADFFDYPYITQSIRSNTKDSLKVICEGIYEGEHDIDSDRMFAGNKLDIILEIQLSRVASRVGYLKPEIKVSGTVQDWRDPEDID